MNQKSLEFKTNVDLIDEENALLIEASELLTDIGDQPGVTVSQLYLAMTSRGIAGDRSQDLLSACVSIETMMTLEIPALDGSEPTIH
jgi:hypothetical protein